LDTGAVEVSIPPAKNASSAKDVAACPNKGMGIAKVPDGMCSCHVPEELDSDRNCSTAPN